MKDTDRIYWLFSEANPAPAGRPATTERPDADVIFHDNRRPIMLTQEPKDIQPPSGAPEHSRWRGPAIALAMFAAVAVLGVAAFLTLTNNEPDVAGEPVLPPVTTAVPAVTTTGPAITTTVPPVVVPAVVAVPDLNGLTLAEARSLLADRGLDIVALPEDIELAVIVAQEPAPGVEVDEGTAVTVDVQIVPTCNPPDPVAPGFGQVTITVLFECGNDEALAPTPGIGVARIVPEQGGEPIDRIEWALRSLLAGPTDDERAVGVQSWFDAATTDALNDVTLSDGHLVVDFNEAIIVNNMSTSTGGLFFNAELQRNVFQFPEVESVEFHFNGDCAAWSGFFESDGCWVITRADWNQRLAEWDDLRNP